jgi:hypothetical protein
VGRPGSRTRDWMCQTPGLSNLWRTAARQFSRIGNQTKPQMKMLPIGIETDPKLSWAISIRSLKVAFSILTMIMLFFLKVGNKVQICKKNHNRAVVHNTCCSLQDRQTGLAGQTDKFDIFLCPFASSGLVMRVFR